MTPMNCNKCGNVIPENSAFCLFCGTPVEQKNNVQQENQVNQAPAVEGQSQPQPAAQPNYSQPVPPPNYGQPMMPPNYGQSVVQPNYGQIPPQPNFGQPVMQPNYYQQPVEQLNYGQPAPPPGYGVQPKKSKKPLVIGIVSIALLLIVGVVLLVIFKPWDSYDAPSLGLSSSSGSSSSPKGVVENALESISKNNKKQLLDIIYPAFVEMEDVEDSYYDIVEDLLGGTDPNYIKMKEYTVDSQSKLDQSEVDFYNSMLEEESGYKKVTEAYMVYGTFEFYDQLEEYNERASYAFVVVKCSGQYYIIDYDVEFSS